MSVRSLTEHEERILRMRRAISDGGEGKTAGEVAAELGCSKQNIYNICSEANRKLGTPPMDHAVQWAKAQLGRASGGVASSTEVKNPEVAAAAFDAATDARARTQTEAIDRVNAELEAAGMPGKVSHAIVRRMRVRYAGAVTPLRAINTKELQTMLEEKIFLAASYLDDKVCAEANARDLGLIVTAMTEKRQLLRGEPTAIISNLDREKLHALIPSMIAEARRRGITVEGTAERVA